MTKNVSQFPSVYLDDDPVYRKTPKDYLRAYTVAELITFLNHYHHLALVSLDNDLGFNQLEGYDFVKIYVDHFLKGRKDWQIDKFEVHSANPIASDHIWSLLKNAKKQGVI